MSSTFLEQIASSEVEKVALKEIESLLHKLAVLEEDSLDDKGYDFWEEISNNLGNLRSRVFADTPGKVVYNPDTNLPETIYSKREGLLDTLSNTSVFSRLYGLAQHDITKPFSTLISASGFMMFESFPSTWKGSLAEYILSIKSEFKKLSTFMKIFLRAAESEFQNTNVTPEEFINTLGANSDTVVNSRGDRVNCMVQIELQSVKDMETFLSIRTIVLNAIDNGARYILIRNVNEYEIEIIDDISESWTSNKEVSDYKDNLEGAYTDGLNNPLEVSKSEERGGAIASYLAGQRFGRSPDKTKRFYTLKDGVEIPALNVKGKSLVLRFTPETSIVNLLKNITAAKVA